MAILFVLAWLKYAPYGDLRPLWLTPMTDPWLIPVYWLALFGLVMGTFIDFEHMIIPNRVTLGGIAIGGLAIGVDRWGLLCDKIGVAIAIGIGIEESFSIDPLPC